MSFKGVGNIRLMEGHPKQPPGMYKTLVDNGITYQPQLVNAGFLNHQTVVMIMSMAVKSGVTS